MKKRIAILVALSLLFTLASSFALDNSKTEAAVSFQRVNFVNAVVTADALNVRQAITVNSPIVCVLMKGQTVKVFGIIGDWYAVYEPSKGCVGVAYSKYLKAATGTQTPTPTPTQKPSTTTPSQKPSTTPTPQTTTPPAGVSQDEQAMLNLVNKARADAGLAPLAFDTELQKVARLKAKDMVDNNYFSHQSPTYGSPFDMMKQFNISFKTAGENIAGNQTVQAAFNAWMNSEGHRKNILNGNYNLTGIGIVSGSPYGKIFVQQFIGR